MGGGGGESSQYEHYYGEVGKVSCCGSESSPRSTSTARTPDFTVLAKIVGLLNLPPHSRAAQPVLY